MYLLWMFYYLVQLSASWWYGSQFKITSGKKLCCSWKHAELFPTYTCGDMSLTNNDNVTKIGMDETNSVCACQRWHHCRWLFQVIIEPQMEDVKKVASTGRGGRRLAWLAASGFSADGSIGFQMWLLQKKHNVAQQWQNNHWRSFLQKRSYKWRYLQVSCFKCSQKYIYL